LSSKSKQILNHESKSISQAPLRVLPHRKAQERGPRDLQEHAPQTAARMMARMICDLRSTICAQAQTSSEMANHNFARFSDETHDIGSIH